MELQIKITTSAELGGAEKAKSILEQTVSQKKFLNQEHAQEEALLKRVQASIAEYKAEVEKATVAKQQMASVDLDPGLEQRLSNEYGAGNSAATIHAEEVRRRRNAAAAQIASDRQSSRANREAAFIAQWSGESTKATKAATDQAAAIGKAKDQMVFFNKEAKEGQALLQGLAMSGLPGVGLAATAAFSATTAGAAAAGLAIASIVSEVTEAKQRLEDFLALEPAFARHADATRGLTQALRDTRVEYAGFLNDLDRIRSAQDDVRKGHEATAKALKDQARELAGLVEGEDALLKKALELAVARGLLSKATADEIAATLALREAEATSAAESLKEKEALIAKEQELARVKGILADGVEIPALRAKQAEETAALERKIKDQAKAEAAADPEGALRREYDAQSSLYDETVARVPELSDMGTKERVARLAELEAQLANLKRSGQGAGLAGALGQAWVQSQIDAFKVAVKNDELVGALGEAQRNKAVLPDEIAALKISTQEREKEIAAREAAVKAAEQASKTLPVEFQGMQDSFALSEERRRRELDARRAIHQLEFGQQAQTGPVNVRLAGVNLSLPFAPTGAPTGQPRPFGEIMQRDQQQLAQQLGLAGGKMTARDNTILGLVEEMLSGLDAMNTRLNDMEKRRLNNRYQNR